MKREPATVLYLYGVTQERPPAMEALAGVDDRAPLEAMECFGLFSWYSRVPASEFGAGLAQRMENLDWLAKASVLHQRAVAAIHERAPILPARFGTVFLSEESLCADVSERKAALDEAFRRTAAADEWGVRVFAVPRSVVIAKEVKSGREYLQRKAKVLEARAARAADPEIDAFAAAIRKLSRDATEGGKVSAGQPGLRWQASLLVEHKRRDKLIQLVNRHARQWEGKYRIECTGPWPPYSFVGERAQSQQGRAQERVVR